MLFRIIQRTKLRINSLKSAIPTEWKTYFYSQSKISYLPVLPHLYDKCANGSILNLSQKVYNFLGDDVMLLHNKYIKWRSQLGEDYDESLYEFGRNHLNIYKLTNIPKCRSFQYRLL